MDIKNDKRIIIEKEINHDLSGFENIKYSLEEYFPYRKDNFTKNQFNDKINFKKLKIIIDNCNIEEAINFLQECQKEIKKRKYNNFPLFNLSFKCS